MSDFKNILAINFGGIGDEIFFLPTLISLKKQFPQAKIQSIANAGHWLHAENPKDFIEAILEFLEQ